MPGKSAGNHGNHIKSHALRACVASEKKLCGANDACALAQPDGFGGERVFRPRLYFNEANDARRAFRDKVDLSGPSAHALAQNSIAFAA